MRTALRRVALVFRVTEFGGPRLTADNELDVIQPPAALPFLHEAEELQKALSANGFEVLPTVGGVGPTGVEMTDAIRSVVREYGPDDLVVVHVLSHGKLSEQTVSLQVAGSDGRWEDANVADWILDAEERAAGPTIVFLLDLCHGGRAVEFEKFVRLANKRKVWLLAASGPAQLAFSARFTRAVTAVLSALNGDGEPVQTKSRWIGYSDFTAMVRKRVNRFVTEDTDADPQRVTASWFEAGTEADLPLLFINGDEPVAPLPVLESASPRPWWVEIPFVGRARELDLLAQWLVDDDSPDVLAITGAPGSGKSALLNAFAHALHPDLPPESRPTLPRVDLGDYQVVQVDARRRDRNYLLLEITATLFGTRDSLDLAALATGLDRLKRVVLVVDGVEEALADVMTDLLVPLSRTPGVKVALAVRSVPAVQCEVVDLDSPLFWALREDLRVYAENLLAAGCPEGGLAGIGAKVAKGLAETLEVDAGSRVLGEFLIARNYVRHVLKGQLPTADTATAVGADVPSTVAGSFELDPEVAPSAGWARAVLATLAQAPASGLTGLDLCALAPLFTDDDGRLTVSAFSGLLPALSHYLRISGVETTVRYHLFDARLEEHLRLRPYGPNDDRQVGPAELFSALLQSVTRSGRRGWDRTPVHQRHTALEFAARADRLDELLADPEYLFGDGGLREWIRELAPSPIVNASAAVLDAGTESAAELALVAARAGSPKLASALAGTKGLVPAFAVSTGAAARTETPVVRLGADRRELQVELPDRRTETIRSPATFSAATAGFLTGSPFVFAGLRNGQRQLWIRQNSGWDFETISEDGSRVVAAVTLEDEDGEPVVVVETQSGRLSWWSPVQRRPRGVPIQLGEPLKSLSLARDQSGALVAIAETTRGTHGFDATGSSVAPGSQWTKIQTGDVASVVARATPGGVLVAYGKPARITLLNDSDRTELAELPEHLGAPSRTVATGEWTAFVMAEGERLRAVDPMTGKVVADSVVARGWFAVPSSCGPRSAWVPHGDGVLTVTGPDAAVTSATTGHKWSHRVHDGAVTAIAAWTSGGKPRVASSTENGEVRVWDPMTGTVLASTEVDDPVVDLHSLCAAGQPDRLLVRTTTETVIYTVGEN